MDTSFRGTKSTAQNPHESTLFHLVPRNDISNEVLRHPDNQRFVSLSCQGSRLEAGFHVAGVAYSASKATFLQSLDTLADMDCPM